MASNQVENEDPGKLTNSKYDLTHNFNLTDDANDVTKLYQMHNKTFNCWGEYWKLLSAIDQKNILQAISLVVIIGEPVSTNSLVLIKCYSWIN